MNITIVPTPRPTLTPTELPSTPALTPMPDSAMIPTSSPGPVPVQLTDGTPLLTTLIQSGAALVAIIAGLLIARLVALSTERASLERRLRELTAIRDARATDYVKASMDLLEADRNDFIDDIFDDFLAEPEESFEHWYTRFAAGNDNVRPAEQLGPAFEQFVTRADEVAGRLGYHALIDAGPPAGWNDTERDRLLAKFPHPRDEQIAARLIEIAEESWAEQKSSNVWNLADQLRQPALRAIPGPGDAARYRDLVREEVRSQAMLDAADLDLKHARQALVMVGSPKGLKTVLALLAGITVCGIVIPLMHLTLGSPAVPAIARIVYSGLFILSLAAFFYYLAVEVRRLTEPPGTALLAQPTSEQSRTG